MAACMQYVCKTSISIAEALSCSIESFHESFSDVIAMSQKTFWKSCFLLENLIQRVFKRVAVLILTHFPIRTKQEIKYMT